MKEVFKPFGTLVEDVGIELGITVKGQNILSSTDKDTLQIGRQIIETCQDVLNRFPWRVKIGDDPWVLKEDGSYAFALTDDTDTPLFDSRVLTDGAKWRYLNAKGLTYSEPFRFYEKRIYDFAFNFNGDRVVDTNEHVATII